MMMNTDFTTERKTKLCPFCAEIIMARALKCRHCGEILDPDRIKAVEQVVANKTQNQVKGDNDVLFAGRPSLWALTGSFFKAVVILIFAAFLIVYPVENLFASKPVQQQTSAVHDSLTGNQDTTSSTSAGTSGIEKDGNQGGTFKKYRITIGAGLCILILLILAVKVLKLKTKFYEVSKVRIEYHRGIFDRKVDNLDMFRIIDMRLRRSFLDCITGIGSVTVMTTDKTDPEFTFEKVRNCKKLYDVIKKASLAADRKGNVVHIE